MFNIFKKTYSVKFLYISRMGEKSDPIWFRNVFVFKDGIVFNVLLLAFVLFLHDHNFRNFGREKNLIKIKNL
jgi:hypothetical protein